MEVSEVLHMNGGVGENSYASNSTIQENILADAKWIREEAIMKVQCNSYPTILCVAELGCSSGPNALLVVSELIEMVHKRSKKHGHQTPQIQVHLNDLPNNDSNTLFRSLQNFEEQTQKKIGFGKIFITGVPGSFYGRLFPTRSLHFVHSSSSLMWLSQVPQGVESNKGNICIAKTSPPLVLKSYYEQFQRDFSSFLKCRSEELVSGGRMVLTIVGRERADFSSKDGCYILELLAMALNEVVSLGLIEEEKMDSFNMPLYTPTLAEVRYEVEREGSFVMDCEDISRVEWEACGGNGRCSSNDFNEIGAIFAQWYRAVAESLLAYHFDPRVIIDEVFPRFANIVAHHLAKHKSEILSVIVSLIRKEVDNS